MTRAPTDAEAVGPEAFAQADEPGVTLDLLDDDLYADGDPDAVLRELRASRPVVRQADPGFYAILTHAGITEALRAVKTLSSASRTELEDLPDDFPRSILHMDPPRHTKVRKLLGPEFAPTAVARMEPRIRSITRELLDAVPVDEEFDFATEVADALPMRVIGRLIGIPSPTTNDSNGGTRSRSSRSRSGQLSGASSARWSSTSHGCGHNASSGPRTTSRRDSRTRVSTTLRSTMPSTWATSGRS
jgi:cytochrome P450